MFVKAARLDGATIDELMPYLAYIEDYRAGAFELGAPNEHVLEVTGRPAEDFETIARRYAALPASQPSLANRMRTLATFMAIPFSPGYDLKEYARVLNEPRALRATPAVESDVWRREHGLPQRADSPVGRASPPMPTPSLERRLSGRAHALNTSLPATAFGANGVLAGTKRS